MQENAQTTEENQITFDDLGLNKEILRSVKQAGFTTPSPIQAVAIPFVLQGRDIVGQAHTGTGKTAAFGLPALNNIDVRNGVEILVITPTRELATQVSDELYKYGRNINARTVTV
ncbi:MAG: DEAD/DEAH box helicase, partial [Campylobacterota bacterium]|nr:DEAD/DEAH box helicase [Campylobacterota bacterium]